MHNRNMFWLLYYFVSHRGGQSIDQEFNILHFCTAFSITTMSFTKPKFMKRAKEWTAEVENLFRFQEASYRDEHEYRQVKQGALVNIL